MPKNTALAKVEESAAVEKRPDKKLVDETVAWIQEKLTETMHRGLGEIGDHILDEFFGGDPDQAQSRAPNKAASFQALLKRCESVELPLRQSALYAAIQSAGMRRRLGAGGKSFKLLPPSHQQALLPLRDPARVEEVAKKAVDRQLSVRDLKVIVAKEWEKAHEGEKRGRTAMPLIVKTLNRTMKLFALESGRRSFTKTDLDELSDEQAKDALKAAGSLVGSLQKLIEKLGQRG